MNFVRNHVFFQDELDAIRQRLEQPKRANPGRSPAILDTPDDLAFQPGHIGDTGEQEKSHQGNLDCGENDEYCCVSHLFISTRSEEHTSELQSQSNLVCRLLLEKK